MQIFPSSGIESFSVANCVFTNLSNLIVLFGEVATSSNFCTFRRINPPTGVPANAGYQVTAGKILTIRAVKLVNYPAETIGMPAFQYTDNDIGIDAASPGTNPKLLSGAGMLLGPLSFQASTGLSQNKEAAIFWTIPAAKYPGYGIAATNCPILAYGYEK